MFVCVLFFLLNLPCDKNRPARAPFKIHLNWQPMGGPGEGLFTFSCHTSSLSGTSYTRLDWELSTNVLSCKKLFLSFTSICMKSCNWAGIEPVTSGDLAYCFTTELQVTKQSSTMFRSGTAHPADRTPPSPSTLNTSLPPTRKPKKDLDQNFLSTQR